MKMHEDIETTVLGPAAFLSWLRPEGPWVLTAINPEAKGIETRTLATESDVAEFIAKFEGKRNLYYSLNPTKTAMTSKASKADIARVEFLHADLDPEDAEPPEAGKARMLALIEKHEPRPSAVIDSGNGLQALWRLDEPIENPLDAEPYNMALLVNAFANHPGTHNCDRILRIPGTKNLPTKKKTRIGRTVCESTIIWTEATSYPLSDFPTFTPAEEATVRLENAWRDTRTEVPPLIDPDDFSVDTLPITDELKTIIREGCYEKKFKGDRSRAVFHVAREILRAGLGEVILRRILSNPSLAISAHVLDQSNPERAATRTIANAKTSLESFTKNGDGKIIPTVPANVRVAVAQMGISLRYCSFSDRVLIDGLPDFGPELDDNAVNRIWFMIDDCYKFRPNKEFLRTVIIDDAVTRHRFNPVADHLDALVWDGTPRLDDWIIRLGGAEDTPFVRAVSRIMLVAGVRRIRKPGCKFDELPVFESPTQGTDKSTAIEVLAIREDWFTDSLPLSADPKVVIEQTRGKWIVEAGELSGMARTEIEKLKGMLSRRTDRGRLAYARLAVDAPRQFLTIGTTNTREYLKDQTGNRRFWPVEIARFDIPALRAERDQLWAEASVAEAAGESIRLDPSLWNDAGIEQLARTATDPWVEALHHGLAGFDDARVSAEAVWTYLGVNIDRRTQDQNARMGAAMRKIGFDRPKGGKMVSIRGKNVSGYRRGEGVVALDACPKRCEGGEVEASYFYDIEVAEEMKRQDKEQQDAAYRRNGRM